MKKLTGIGLFVALLLSFAVGANAQQPGGQAIRRATLTAEEAQWITQIRVDEKLARDTYLKLYSMWGLPVFYNIAQSEQKHMDAVLTLIDKYNLVDPVKGLGVGEFPPDIQPVFDGLLEDGSQGLVEALEVGVYIEELDIADLTNALLVVQKADIRNVFNNLLAASLKHLAAFESHLN
jgi:hypothetical protein